MNVKALLTAVAAAGLMGAGTAIADPIPVFEEPCLAAVGEKDKLEAEQLIVGEMYEIELKCVDGWAGNVFLSETENEGVVVDRRLQLTGTRDATDDDEANPTSACAIDIVLYSDGLPAAVAPKSEAKCSESLGNGKPSNEDKLELEIKKMPAA